MAGNYVFPRPGIMSSTAVSDGCLQILLFAKILAYVSGDRSVTITDAEMEMAAGVLRRIADQRFDWTQEQREQYKAMVSIVRYMR